MKIIPHYFFVFIFMAVPHSCGFHGNISQLFLSRTVDLNEISVKIVNSYKISFMIE